MRASAIRFGSRGDLDSIEHARVRCWLTLRAVGDRLFCFIPYTPRVTVPDSPDDRVPMARAIALASSVTTVALEMAVPALLGYWIDKYLGVSPLFIAAGAALGLFAGIRSLMILGRPRSTDQTDRGEK